MDFTTILIISTFLISAFIGIPIAFVLGLTAIGYFAFISNVPITIVAQSIYSGTDSFVLLAIPFFILAGELMNRTGITRDLIKFVDIFLGKLPGALAQVNIGVSILFAGLTGAAVADTAAIGSILIPAMKEQGYTSSYSAAVTASSSVIGPIIPPSIIMVVYATITGESVAALFLGGFVPGLLIGLSLMVLAYIHAVKRNYPRRTTSLSRKEMIDATKNALFAILMPVIIIGGILSGQFTPTEAAAIACLYALLLGLFYYRTLNLKNIMLSILNSGKISATILFIIATAKLVSTVLTLERIPTQLAQLLFNVTDNRYIFLFFVGLLLIFMGMIMETTANVILLTPILLPIAIRYGIEPLHFAMIMMVGVNIGLATPPLGVCLFTATPIAKCSFESIAKDVIPFNLAEIVVLFLIIYIPELILFVPRTFGYI